MDKLDNNLSVRFATLKELVVNMTPKALTTQYHHTHIGITILKYGVQLRELRELPIEHFNYLENALGRLETTELTERFIALSVEYDYAFQQASSSIKLSPNLGRLITWQARQTRFDAAGQHLQAFLNPSARLKQSTAALSTRPKVSFKSGYGLAE